MDRRRLIALKRGRLRATGETVSVTVDTPKEIFPLRNDQGAKLRITHIDDLPISDGGSAVDVAHGQVDLDDGMLTFTPDSAYTGTFAFRYTVTDGKSSRVGTIKGTVS